MRIILLRHTESEANFKKIYGGRYDFKLTKKGIGQIKELVDILNRNYIYNCDNPRLYSSPLSRSKKFADAISKTLKCKAQVDYRLVEFDFGVFEGYSYDELKDNEFYKLWCEDYFNYCIPKGESLAVFRARVESFIKEVLKSDGNKDLIIVSHEGVTKIIMLYLLKLPIESFWNFYCGNGSIVEIIYENNFAYIKNLYNN